MSRVTTTITTAPSAPAPAGPESARYFIVGQTQKGVHASPGIVTSMAGYESAYGARAGGTSMYDAAQLALRTGVGELVVQRAVGPTPVAATVSLDSGAIVVTSRQVGAFANGWTAAWDVSEHALTVVGDGVTETYVGATSAALILAASYSSRIVVTSSGTLPVADVTATAMASGADDFANVVWTTELAKISPDLGPGAISVPGVAHGTVGVGVGAHCASTARFGLLTAASGASVATLTTAAATIAGYANSEYLALVGPWVVVPDGAGATRTVDPTPFAAGLRAAAQRVGAGESAGAVDYARGIVDVTPEYQTSASEWATLHAAGVSNVRTVGAITRLYSYLAASAMNDNPYLRGGNYRDLVNAIQFAGDAILESHTQHAGSGDRQAQVVGELKTMLAGLSAAGYLFPRVAADGSQSDPGYTIAVNTGTGAADNRWVATISLRCTESIDFFDFTLAVGDAGATL